MKEIIPKSKNRDVRDNMSCTERGKKPPTYNQLWYNYIHSKWDIDDASENSESLRKAVERIESTIRYFMKEN